MNEKNLSPCIGSCCLDNQDICLGCYRHLTEITGWRALTSVEQKSVLVKCEHRKAVHNE